MFLHKLRARIVLLIAFLGLLAGGGWIIGLQAHASRTGEPPASEEPSRPQAAVQKESARAPHPVTVSRPLRRQAAPFQDYTGRLEARRSVEVRPAVGGFIEKVCFKAGAEVKKGDVLFELSSRASRLALDRARAELELAMVKKKQRDAEVARAQNLKARGAIGRDELDAITERAAIGEAAVKTARIEMDRAELELDATKVRAPMSGRVGRPLVDLGALVFRGQDSATLLTTVTSLDPISLLFEMDELSFLRYQRLLRDKQVKGEGSSLRMALASEEGFPHEGTLESFEDRVSPQTGTVRVRGSFANPDRLLLPGMFARVRMTIGPPRAVLEIPREAVLIDQGKTYVLVVREANIAERRPVTLGSADNGMRIIERGLGAEDWVVIAGLGGVRPGDRVEPRKAAPPTQKAPAGNRGH